MSASLSTLGTLSIPTPRAFVPLLGASRYKGAHGGRGSGKSHTFAEMLIERCVEHQTRAACIREVQNSLKESVKQLLADKIEAFGLSNSFEILQDEIRCPFGGLIIFKGMQSFNATNIKSLEGYDVAWVEEAQTLSSLSLRLLRPTLRKPGSELWFTWNPRFDTDPVDQLLRGANKPSGSAVIEVNWYDNPWFPDVLRQEMIDDMAADPEMAEHVWGGGYEVITEGAYYARLLAQAQKDGRVGAYPYNPLLPVKTAWDIGVDDHTAVWFVQEDGRHAFVVDYYEISGEGAEPIVAACMPELLPDPVATTVALSELGRALPFRYGEHFFPHDVMNREWGSGGRSRLETLQGLGLKQIHVGVATDPAERVNAVRRILPIMHFNDTPRVQSGLSRLRRYRRKYNDALGTYTTPLHDMNSHGSDAFGEFAVNCSIIAPKPVALSDKGKLPGFSRIRRTTQAHSFRTY